jgi:hypothetical protein
VDWTRGVFDMYIIGCIRSGLGRSLVEAVLRARLCSGSALLGKDECREVLRAPKFTVWSVSHGCQFECHFGASQDTLAC